MRKLIISMLIMALWSMNLYAEDNLKNVCPDGIKPSKSLINIVILKKSQNNDKNGTSISESYTANINNKSGTCFKVDFAQFAYLIDEKHAIYRIGTDTGEYYIPPQHALFDFTNGSARYRRISAIIKASGDYFDYKDKEGIPRKMPRFFVLKENKI